MKIDWTRKLTSRKFWAAIVGFVVPLIIASGGTAEFATEVTAIIMAGATVIAYIIGEGLTDSANAGLADKASPGLPVEQYCSAAEIDEILAEIDRAKEQMDDKTAKKEDDQA